MKKKKIEEKLIIIFISLLELNYVIMIISTYILGCIFILVTFTSFSQSNLLFQRTKKPETRSQFSGFYEIFFADPNCYKIYNAFQKLKVHHKIIPFNILRSGTLLHDWSKLLTKHKQRKSKQNHIFR